MISNPLPPCSSPYSMVSHAPSSPSPPPTNLLMFTAFHLKKFALHILFNFLKVSGINLGRVCWLLDESNRKSKHEARCTFYNLKKRKVRLLEKVQGKYKPKLWKFLNRFQLKRSTLLVKRKTLFDLVQADLARQNLFKLIF